MRHPARLLRSLVLALVAGSAGLGAAGGFQPNWGSLSQAAVPSWLAEARFGISVHWGVASVPGQHRDYARLMYLPPEVAEPATWFMYHRRHYGPQGVFGYKDLIPYWEGKAWDPPALVQRFVEAGAGYVVVLATDRDNFDLFPSPFQSWNSARMGPQRDIVGGWAAACRARGLPWGVALHHAESWWWLRPSQGAHQPDEGAEERFDGQLSLREVEDPWWQGANPRELYGSPRAGDPFAPLSPAQKARDPIPAAVVENGYRRLDHLTRTYDPDLVWFSSPLPYGDLGLRWAADFLEGGRERGRITRKAIALPPSQANRGVIPTVIGEGPAPRGVARWQREVWLAEEGMRTDRPPRLDATAVLAHLITTVADGGNLLLSVNLDADGRLPESHAAVLAEVGAWLKQGRTVLEQARPAGPAPMGALALLRQVSAQRLIVFFRERPSSPAWRWATQEKVLSAQWLGQSAPAEFSQNPEEGLTVRVPTSSPLAGPQALLLTVEPVPEPEAL